MTFFVSESSLTLVFYKQQSMVNVFMIDDHPAMIEGISFQFSEPEDRVRLVGSSLNATDALFKMPSLDVQVILLDLFINTDSPVSNLQLLRAAWPDMPVVIYSAEDSTWWKYKMFGLRVNAFLNKCIDNETIITSILQVSNGSVLLPSDVKDMLNPVIHSFETASLTWEDLEVGKEMSFGLSIKEIAEKLHKSPSSIEKHLRIMRMKTHTHSNPDLTRTLISRKLVPLSR